MRFSNYILAAGLTASAFAAPVAPTEDDDSCPADETTTVGGASTAVVAPVASSSVVAPATVQATSSVVAASSVAPTSSVVASSSAAAVVASSSSSAVVAVASSSASAAVAASTGSASSTTSTGKLQFIGASESGAEFGTAIPGVLGTDYTFANTTAIQTLIDDGMNMFRLPFLMERMTPSTMTAALDATYLAGYKTVVDYVTAAGAMAVLDPHNYGRYSGSIFTSTSDFATFWGTMATEFKDNANVVFDINNEFHDEPAADTVAVLSQAAVTAIRAAGATTQYIFLEGTSYTGAWTWDTSGNSANMGNITDPNDMLVYEMHQYLDSDGSGTSSTCVSTTIGAERIADATTWLQTNGFKGIIGEFAGGVNSDCETAVSGMLDALAAANDVWIGAMWWGAGPWWGDYIYSLEPPSGTCYSAYIDTLVSYVDTA